MKHMELLNALQQYWSIILFIGVFIASWVENKSQIVALKKQDSDTEQRITDIKQETEAKLTKLESDFSSHKDKSTEILGLIQADIRELMTLIKNNKN